MKRNPVKAALKAGQPQIGTWLSCGDLYATRVMARIGFPWLTVDMEHSPIDWAQASMLFSAIAEAGCVPLVRVPRGTHENIKRALDAGAHGIVVPMVNTVEEAKLAVAAAKYPPAGNRSIGGGLHALNFDASAGDYFKYANDEVLVVLQTESPTGVANAEEIYALPGCDAIFVGPNDLRWQMRKQGAPLPTDAEFEGMLSAVVAAGKKTGCATGMHTFDVESALARAKQGMQFIAVGSDLRFLSVAAQATVKGLHPDSAAKEMAKY